MVEPKIHNILGVNVKCLTYCILCNEHLNYYQTIDEYYDKDSICDINTSLDDDVIQLQIYEHTPIGRTEYIANSIDDIILELKKDYK